MRYIGIDYSLTSPAVCILGPDLSFQSSKHYYLTDTKKYQGVFGNITGHQQPFFTNDMQRYLGIASWALYSCGIQKGDLVFLEGYSMGSKGQVFNIAENTAILKYLLYSN